MEKIVEKVVYVPKLTTVDVNKDIIIDRIEVRNAREVVNHIQKVPEIVEIVHEKPIALVQTVERIVEVPKIIEKIVEVRTEVTVIK